MHVPLIIFFSCPLLSRCGYVAIILLASLGDLESRSVESAIRWESAESGFAVCKAVNLWDCGNVGCNLGVVYKYKAVNYGMTKTQRRVVLPPHCAWSAYCTWPVCKWKHLSGAHSHTQWPFQHWIANGHFILDARIAVQNSFSNIHCTCISTNLFNRRGMHNYSNQPRARLSCFPQTTEPTSLISILMVAPGEMKYQNSLNNFLRSVCLVLTLKPLIVCAVLM